MIDSVQIVGVVGNKPTVQHNPGESKRVWVSVKTEKRTRKSDGSIVVSPKWHNVSARGSVASAIADANPGDVVEISGTVDYYKKTAYNVDGVPFQYSVAFILAYSAEITCRRE